MAYMTSLVLAKSLTKVLGLRTKTKATSVSLVTERDCVRTNPSLHLET